MLPSNNAFTEYEEYEEPTKTFYIDFESGRITKSIDGIDAIKQAIIMILATERYEYLIHTWDYGFETQDLIGEDIGYVYPELKRRIVEALTQDSRIDSVDTFEFDKKGKVVTVSFVVHSTLGDITEETVVMI